MQRESAHKPGSNRETKISNELLRVETVDENKHVGWLWRWHVKKSDEA